MTELGVLTDCLKRPEIKKILQVSSLFPTHVNQKNQRLLQSFKLQNPFKKVSRADKPRRLGSNITYVFHICKLKI